MSQDWESQEISVKRRPIISDRNVKSVSSPWTSTCLAAAKPTRKLRKTGKAELAVAVIRVVAVVPKKTARRDCKAEARSEDIGFKTISQAE